MRGCGSERWAKTNISVKEALPCPPCPTWMTNLLHRHSYLHSNFNLKFGHEKEVLGNSQNPMSLKSMNFHGCACKFPGEEDRFRLAPWAFRPVKHSWKYFFTLTSFPDEIRDFTNLKGTWHQMLLCPHQLQGILGFLKPLFHVQILDWSWSVDKNDDVFHWLAWGLQPRSTKLEWRCRLCGVSCKSENLYVLWNCGQSENKNSRDILLVTQWVPCTSIVLQISSGWQWAQSEFLFSHHLPKFYSFNITTLNLCYTEMFNFTWNVFLSMGNSISQCRECLP